MMSYLKCIVNTSRIFHPYIKPYNFIYMDIIVTWLPQWTCAEGWLSLVPSCSRPGEELGQRVAVHLAVSVMLVVFLWAFDFKTCAQSLVKIL